jgi:DNA repair photolyase
MINLVKSKKALQKSKISEYCINPYLGCFHGCPYCYASMMMQRWHHQKEEWGKFVDVRINVPELLRKEIRNKENLDIYISSMTDPYQPVEEKYQITRKVLEVLLEREKSEIFPSKIFITIQTKSNLVLRDLDLLKEFKNITVGLTITTLDETWSKVFEKGAATPLQRLKALGILNANKIKTYAFVGPIIPHVSDDFGALFKIVKEIEETCNKRILFDSLNYFSNLRRLKKKTLELSIYDEFKAYENTGKLANLREILLRISTEFPGLDFEILF